jgi:hypothetical protein
VRRHLTSFSIGVLGVIVGAALVSVPGAMGATGDPMTVGQANFADAATRVIARAQNGLVVDNNRTNGVAAAFKVQPGNQPFTVDSGVRVEHLNADRIDGRHANGLARMSSQEVQDLSEGNGALLITTIQVPAPGYLLAIGSLEVWGTEADQLNCAVAFSGNNGVSWVQRGQRSIKHVVGGAEICASQGMHPVTAGPWQAALWVGARDAASFDDAGIAAVFIPFGADGTPP